jgi:hypothetical protein
MVKGQHSLKLSFKRAPKTSRYSFRSHPTNIVLEESNADMHYKKSIK